MAISKIFSKMLLWLFAISCYFCGTAAAYKFNMTKYFKMPNLYDFDDYDRCLQAYNNNNNQQTYCFVRAEVLPQASSEIWQTIAEISKYDKHHYDHRHLYYGICVRWCEEQLADLAEDVAKELYVGLLTTNTKLNTYVALFKAEEPNRQQYNKLLNQCVNLKLARNYGLRAVSMVEYCNTNRKAEETDAWNVAFLIITFALLLLITCSSFYDFQLKHKRSNKEIAKENHYRNPVEGFVNRIGVSFSIARNWYRLNEEPIGKLGRDLRFLDCFKFFCMFLVVFAHTNWILYEGAVSNPQDNERFLHTLGGTFVISGGLITITFFIFSGLLLTVNWLAFTKVKSEMSVGEYLLVFLKFNLFRYLRLTIPYAFVILLHAASYGGDNGGPLWRHIVEREQLACRKNWWANLLYINIYYNNNEKCMLQGWYLGADTFSFIISLLVLMLAHKWPQYSKRIYGGIFGFFFVLPGLVAYFGHYDPLFVPAPQIQKDSFIGDRQFNEFYAPFYMNFACYFCGVLAALAYDEISNQQYKLHKNKLMQCIWYALIPVGILWLFSAHPIYQHMYEEQERSRFWESVYAAMQRNFWGMGLGVFVVGMACKVGGLFLKFSCLPIFRVLGRLTYGAYMIHIFVSRLLLGNLRTPLYFGLEITFSFVLSTLVISYVLSLILALLLELPTSALLKLMR